MAKNFGKSNVRKTLQEVANKSSMEHITVLLEIDLLKENKDNEYLFGMENIKLLADGIKKNGWKGAIEVWDLSDGTYEIISGHRRVRALKMNGEEKVLAFVYPLPEEEADKRRALLGANLYGRNSVDNSQPIYTARQLEYHKETLEMEGFKGDMREQLAREFGSSGSQVYKYMSLLKLNEGLQRLITEGVLPMTAGSAMAVLDEQQQEKAYECVYEYLEAEETISRKDAMKIIEQIKNVSETNSLNAGEVVTKIKSPEEEKKENIVPDDEQIDGQYELKQNGDIVENSTTIYPDIEKEETANTDTEEVVKEEETTTNEDNADNGVKKLEEIYKPKEEEEPAEPEEMAKDVAVNHSLETLRHAANIFKKLVFELDYNVEDIEEALEIFTDVQESIEVEMERLSD